MTPANQPEIVIISALAANRTIGQGGKLPWYIPADLKRFRALTLYHPVIMGRKTWESDLGKRPLPDRTNIIVSKSYFDDPLVQPAQSAEGKFYIVPSIAAAFQQVQDQSRLFIIGGASIYAQTLHLADRLELTLVEGCIEGDTFFPDYETLLREQFVLTQDIPYSGYRFLTYCRRS